MVWVLFSFRLETGLEVAVVSRPLLDRSPGVGLACRGVVVSGDLSTHNDINLFFDWLYWVRLMILVRTPFGVDSLGLDSDVVIGPLHHLEEPGTDCLPGRPELRSSLCRLVLAVESPPPVGTSFWRCPPGGRLPTARH
ncbi:hypothetical protein GW17_00059156 [Ensete ventricosum]|nr:hypothetical protein GW17_00059156 [Ensete ventricosum]